MIRFLSLSREVCVKNNPSNAMQEGGVGQLLPTFRHVSSRSEHSRTDNCYFCQNIHALGKLKNGTTQLCPQAMA